MRIKWIHRSLSRAIIEACFEDVTDAIRKISFNPRSANLLIHYDPSLDPNAILLRLDQLLPVTQAGDHGKKRKKIRHRLIKSGANRGSVAAAAHTPQPGHAWHLLSADEVIPRLHADPDNGLAEADCRSRILKYGLNRIEEPKRDSQWLMFSQQLTSIPVALLGVSSVISILTGGIADAGVILGVVGINAMVGFFTERQAEHAIAALSDVAPQKAKVIRNHAVQTIDAEQMVIGDTIVLEPGSFIPADGRIIRVQQLSIDESSLTGESFPVLKQNAALSRADTPMADRNNMVYTGTMVTSGSGIAIVVATAHNTELGKLQALAHNARAPETPMQKNLDHLGTQLALISSGICLLLIPMGLARRMPLMELLKTSISLGVAAVPEGLPTVATSILALGVQDMKRCNILVRRMDAVENLGQVQTFCMDKTGTLTQNKMTVVACQFGHQRLHIPSGDENPTDSPDIDHNPHLQKIARIVSLCSDSTIQWHGNHYELTGSPTENALLELAVRCHINIHALREAFPLLETQYRTEQRHYMQTVHQSKNDYMIAVKGSPMEVADLCQWYWDGAVLQPCTPMFRQQLQNHNEQFGEEALRVLGVAFAETPSAPDDGAVESLIWLGLVGMIDPARKGIAELIDRFHGAGIRTVMITGDQSSTAYAIAKSLHLSGETPLESVDSTHLDKLDPKLLQALVKKAHVYSRVSPSHKLQIVKALQDAGQIVAMTGDGINDGPALKAADIGVAMGRDGTDIAIAAADLVLEDDNLTTMLVALKKGRAIYNNIHKTIHFLLSTNLSEIEVMMICVAMGWGQPFNPMQLLWINLVTDIFPGLGLALEPPEDDILQYPPRDPKQAMVQANDFYQFALESSFISTGALLAYRYGIHRYGQDPRANTLAFYSLNSAILLHTLSCRSEHKRIWQTKPDNPYLWGALGISFGLLGLTLLPGLRRILRVTPLRGTDWLVIPVAALAPLLANESWKAVQQKQAPKWSQKIRALKNRLKLLTVMATR